MGLQDNEFIFDFYDANQLQAILENQRDAFNDGVLADGVIPRTAALTARKHGDVRKIVDTFYEAGQLAEKVSDSEGTEDYVDDALTKAEVNQFQRLVSG